MNLLLKFLNVRQWSIQSGSKKTSKSARENQERKKKPGSRSGNRERTDGYSGSNDRVPGKTNGR